VEFLEDSDTLSTGNGKMDLTGYGDSLLIGDFDNDGRTDTTWNVAYDPPHTRRFFANQMRALRNLFQANSGGRLHDPDSVDYYEEGRLEITYDVHPLDTLRSYTLNHEMAYYADYGNTDNWGLGLGMLLRDALAAAELDVPSFSAYDSYIIFHAGSCWQATAAFGSRPYDLPTATISFGPEPLLFHAGRDSVWDGIITSEMARFELADDTLEEGLVLGLQGLLAHEFGHQLGLPDLYDVTYQSAGVGGWCLMSEGGWLGGALSGSNIPEGLLPGQLSAWCKVFLGWIEPLPVNEDGPRTLRAVEFPAANPPVLRIPIDSKEHFLLENRQAETALEIPNTVVGNVEDGVIVCWDDYDFLLPGSGLLIWHVDERIIDEKLATNEINTIVGHKGVDLEEADGIQDLDRWTDYPYNWIGSPYDPFFAGNNEAFTPTTTPDSRSYSGAQSHIRITQIGASDTAMTMDIRQDWNHPGFPAWTAGPLDINSPAIADLNRDGRAEIVIGSSDGRIYAWNHDGSKLIENTDSLGIWKPQGKDSVLVTYPLAIFAETGGPVFSSPAIGDLDRDDTLEVVVGSGDGGVYAFKPRDDDGDGRADLLAHFPLPTGNWVVGSPCLADLDGNGTLEVIVGSDDWKVHAWENHLATGEWKYMSGFPVDLGIEVRSTPAVANLDSDAQLEMAILSADGRLHVLNHDGTPLSGWPQLTPRLGFTFSSPAIGDLDRDGSLEIVSASAEGKLWVFGASGEVKHGWPAILDTVAMSSPALGNIDGDGYLEVVIAAGKRVFAFNHNGTAVSGWPRIADSSAAIASSPLLGDIDADGGLDILIGTPGAVLQAWSSRGDPLAGFPLSGGGPVYSTAALGSFEGEGDLQVVVGSDDGSVYAWDLPAGYSAERFPWPCFHGNLAHTGLYPQALYPPPPQPQGSLLPAARVYNYPNPARDSHTTIRYYLAREASVSIKIYNLAGDLVAKMAGPGEPGTENEVPWNLDGVASGVYFCKVEASSSGETEAHTVKVGIVK
jgi:M6 family metalloprotease-like protein